MTDKEAEEASRKSTLTVLSNSVPVITSFSASSTRVDNPFEPVSFTASATDPDGDSLSYSLDFGDGSSGSGQTMTHAYRAKGDYTVRLTVTDGQGGIVSRQLVIHVDNLPPAAPSGLQADK